MLFEEPIIPEWNALFNQQPRREHRGMLFS